MRPRERGDRAAGMRTLHVYSGNMFGGIEAYLVTLAGHSCGRHEFAVCWDDRLSRTLRERGGTVHLLEPVRFRLPWTLWRARKKLGALLQRERFDAVVFHGAWAHAAFADVASRAVTAFFLHTRIGHLGVLDRLAARTPPRVMLVASSFTAEASAPMFPGVPVRRVGCPVALPQLTSPVERTRTRTEVREALDAPDDAFVVLIAARIEPLKGHELLIRALARLPSDIDWRVWIAGASQQDADRIHERAMRTLASDLGVASRTSWLGYRDDVPRLLLASDVLCQPNLGGEGFGIAYVEALARGVPVVTTRLGAAPEIIDESCGVLVDAGPLEVASALEALARDPGLRARLGAAGPGRARAVADPEARVADLERALAEVVAQPELVRR